MSIPVDANERKYDAINSLLLKGNLTGQEWSILFLLSTSLFVDTGNHEIAEEIQRMIRQIERNMGTPLPILNLQYDKMTTLKHFTRSNNPEFREKTETEITFYKNSEGRTVAMVDKLSETHNTEKLHIYQWFLEIAQYIINHRHLLEDNIRFSQPPQIV